MNDVARITRDASRERTLKSPAELAAAGLVDAARLPALEEVAARYAVAITPAMAELIQAGDAHDPIAAQFVPDAAELYCRFCFRRETVGPNGAGTLARDDLEAALAYIRGHAEIWEVIVSGGDPLVASPRRLADLMQAIGAIDHIKVVRFHTRVPVISPERVTHELIAALKASGKATWVAIHANHPRELTAEARAAIACLADSGIALVSQTVLLAGINDDPEVLGSLMRGFGECRVKPYYLHHPDVAPGTGHFRLPIARGRAVMKALRGRYSGLCQPTYVLVGPDHVGDGTVEDPNGRVHLYPPA